MSGPTRVPARRGCRLAPAPWSGRPAEQQRRPQLQTGSNGDQAAGGGAPPPGPPSLPPRAPLGGGWAACKTRFSPLENGASTARPPKAAGEKALGPPTASAVVRFWAGRRAAQILASGSQTVLPCKQRPTCTLGSVSRPPHPLPLQSHEPSSRVGGAPARRAPEAGEPGSDRLGSIRMDGTLCVTIVWPSRGHRRWGLQAGWACSGPDPHTGTAEAGTQHPGLSLCPSHSPWASQAAPGPREAATPAKPTPPAHRPPVRTAAEVPHGNQPKASQAPGPRSGPPSPVVGAASLWGQVPSVPPSLPPGQACVPLPGPHGTAQRPPARHRCTAACEVQGGPGTSGRLAAA